MEIRVARDGMKNVVVMAWGEIEEGLEQTIVVDPSTLNHGCTQVKLDQIQYSIEAGVKVRVGWSEDGMVLPLEGRGLLNYYQFDSLQPSSSNQKLWISATGAGAFHLVFDMTKQT
jgi:hypothetical protein